MQVKLDVGPPYGQIDVKVDLPSDYPFRPPTMTITSRIFHPNVYKDSGLVCMRWFKKNQSHNSWSCHVVIVAVKYLNPAPSTQQRHLAWTQSWFGAQPGILLLFWRKCSVDQVTAGPNLTLFFKGPAKCYLRAKCELASEHRCKQRFHVVILVFF